MSLRIVAEGSAETPHAETRQGEVPFGFDEIFFSRTDGRGVIQAGNSVFRRVSGYEGSRLIGAPHRIVRHPVMPKAAFHLLWERLQAGRATGVYVCNRALDGRAYWVFAAVVPIRDGYLSVRIKPSTTFFDRAKALYAELLAAEADGLAPADGAARLRARLVADGYSGYKSFQAQALAAEVTARAGQTSGYAPDVDQAVRATEAADGIEAELTAMSAIFRRALLITTNLRIVASQIGTRGRALGAIADNYALLSNEMIRWINQRMENASGRACGIAGSVSEDLFLKSATALLDEMSDNYARDDEAGLGDPEAERLRLSEAAAQYRVRAEAYHERALRDVADLEVHLAQMRHHVSALDAIRMQCRVEGAHTRANDGALGQIVGQLDTFQDELGEHLSQTMAHGRQIQGSGVEARHVWPRADVP
ncbi:aerotaxis receptor [Cereibacter ovatus]|uniref:Aerotaxis receptor n=1 Tax=Cereibacter ovatus TaxID=439529 RepID=A0A285D421_9RHOB|nr:PAS domain S-box protein [Cereibacter ovatus]SNX74532.1 aerotaxis receptor [Cereibacter ovatus]